MFAFITIFALFGDDFKYLVLPKTLDFYFDLLTLFAMAAFFIEMVLSYHCKPSYRCSFFFLLDLVSTLSMVLDLSYVSETYLSNLE